MRIKIVCTSALLLIGLCQSSLADGDLSVQIGAEGGLHTTNNQTAQFLSRLNTRVQYQSAFDEHFFILKTRIAPELYDFSADRSVVKLAAEIALGRQKSSYGWQAYLINNHYFYNLPADDDVRFSIFILGGQASKPIATDWSARLTLDYLYRDSARQPRLQMDGLRLFFGPLYQFSKRNQGSLDGYAESFRINQDYLPQTAKSNSGWRLGLRLAIQHRSVYIFNGIAQAIGQTSQLDKSISTEYRLNLLWGRYLSGRWSLFLFVNYQTLQAGKRSIPAVLNYTPVENENWIYGKLAFDASKQTVISLSAGYFRDDLTDRSAAFSGWQLLSGVSVKF